MAEKAHRSTTPQRAAPVVPFAPDLRGYVGGNAAAVENFEAFQAAEAAEKDLTPTFEGYEDDRYQEHDGLIEALVAQFNEDKAGFIGATADQGGQIPDMDPAMIKSWMIQETGGGDRRSRRLVGSRDP